MTQDKEHTFMSSGASPPPMILTNLIMELPTNELI